MSTSIPKTQIPLPSFFISRKSGAVAEQWAGQLMERLTERGCFVICQNMFRAGEGWNEKMEEGMKCDFTIALVSAGYFGSQECRDEWQIARLQNTLVPFMVENVELPQQFVCVLTPPLFEKPEKEAWEVIEREVDRIIAEFQRVKPPPSWWRYRWAITAGVLLALLAVFFAQGNSEGVPRTKYAFALGHALATAGLDSSGAPALMFEQSLKGIEMPEGQRLALAQEFRRVESLAGKPEAESVRQEFETKVLAQCSSVFGSALADETRLGSACARLLLVLRYWDSYPPATASAEASRLHAAIQPLLAAGLVPAQLRATLVKSDGINWQDAAYRQRQRAALEQLQQHFDANPLSQQRTQ
jgi:TIR domain